MVAYHSPLCLLAALALLVSSVSGQGVVSNTSMLCFANQTACESATDCGTGFGNLFPCQYSFVTPTGPAGVCLGAGGSNAWYCGSGNWAPYELDPFSGARWCAFPRILMYSTKHSC
jgi:hypothetical protein